MLFSTSSSSSSNRDGSKRRSFIKWMLNSPSASCNTTFALNEVSYNTKFELNGYKRSTKNKHSTSILSNQHAEKSKRVSFAQAAPQRRSYMHSPIHEDENHDNKITIEHYEHLSDDSYKDRNSKYSPTPSVSSNMCEHQPSTKEFVSDIPTRRTSRNYYNNPEIAAKMNALLNNDKATYLSKFLQQQQKQKQQL